MSHTTFVERHLQDVLDGRVAVRIDLPDAQGRSTSFMRPIVKADLDDDAVVQALTDWRNANMRNFFGQFVATCERTRAWMALDLFGAAGRLLFLIESDGRLVGHYGFKDWRDGEVLLDNAMLGERCDHPGLMQQAGRALIAWLFETLQAEKVWGEVLTTNAPALMLNRALGFSVSRKIPMIKVERDGQVAWTAGDPDAVAKAEVYSYQLLLERQTFAQQQAARSA